MKNGLLLFAALLMISGSVAALPSYSGLRGLNRTVDAKPIGAGEFSLALFSFLGLSDDTRTAQLTGGAEDVTDTEYNGTWYITAGVGLSEKLEIAGRLTYVWNCLSRDNIEGREDLSGGENDNDDGFSEAHLFLKYATNPGGGDNFWVGIMPWVGFSIYDGGDSPYVTNYNEYDGIWQPGQPMFEMRRPMIASNFSAGADLLASLNLQPIVIHANIGYHYFKQNFQFTDCRYGTSDTVEVDMDVEDPVLHVAMGIEYPMKGLTLFAEAEWRHFLERDYEAGNSERYDDIIIIQPGLRFPVGSGFACDIVGAFSIDNFDPEYSDLGHHAYQTGEDPTNETRADFAPFPEGYYPNWGVGINLMYSSDLLEDAGTAMMSGTVTDAVTGEFIEAAIAFPGTAVNPAVTNAQTGHYAVEIPEGSITVAVNATGYVEKTETVHVIDDLNFTCDYALQPTIIGSITDMETGLPLRGTVSVGDFAAISATADGDGLYSLNAPEGDWTVTASANGYLPSPVDISLAGREQMVIDFQLESAVIEVGQVLSFDNIYFDFASSNIKPESYAILDEIVTLLNANQNAMVQIAGHTDSDGSEIYNQTLSEQRSASVRNYLVNHGIAASRLTTVGYGETQPVVTNNSAANKAMNRRIEFTVLSNR
ncbi:MAG: OmpA family protein [Candidatus Aegiribacteria sp.]|nr:OmpA family protein [Candidatus Aegiribacteria sp.]